MVGVRFASTMNATIEVLEHLAACVSIGTGYQNPCRNTGQCDSKATCVDNICTFPSVPANLPTACSFDHECPELESCSSDGSCEKGAARGHVPNVSCVFDRDCPSGFQCSAMTCYKASPDAPDHVQGVNCVFRYQCPNGYYCDRMSCYKDPINRDHIPGFPCIVGCPVGYSCLQMTCVRI
uniref:EB domain-containing protein n=1 Tax=Romanomermis culicivorax TaxID=13658 RepID=A0A915HLG4_ROMCU